MSPLLSREAATKELILDNYTRRTQSVKPLGDPSGMHKDMNPTKRGVANMKCIGIRCSNNDFSYAILSGKKATPKLEISDTIAFPKGYTRPQALGWFLQELEGLSKKHGFLSVWAIKGAEAIATKGKEFVERVENEAIVIFHAGSVGVDKAVRKVKSTIAKDLGLPGKASALKTDLDTSIIPEYNNVTDKVKEAILVAWSELK